MPTSVSFDSQEDAMTALMTGAEKGDWGLCDKALEYLLIAHLGAKDLKNYMPSSEEEADDLTYLYAEAGLAGAPEGTLTHHIQVRVLMHMRDRDDEINDAFNEILDL